MKQLALLLVCVAFANAASVQPTQGGYFATGREYVYQYEGQVLTGIPGVSKEVSGIKIVAETRIQMKDFNKCLFRLEQVKLHKMQTQTENPAEQQTPEKLQRLQPELEARLIEQLVKPIEFTYVDGKISNIVTSQDEPVWCTNVKKGVMELMLVNIRGTDDLNQPESQRTEPTSILHQKEHYRVMERGIAGYCESIYNVKVSRSVPNIIEKEVQPSRYVLNITKTRDLLECQRRTQRSKVSILDGKKCVRCNETEEELPQEVPEPVTEPNEQTETKVDMLKCLSKVRYNISLKDHSRFLIDSVVAEGQHIFMPFGPKGGKAVTFVNQTFILKSNREIPDDQVIPEVQTPKEQPEDLRFIFQEWETHRHEEEEDREVTTDDGTHLTQIRTTIKTHLQKIYDSIQDDRITEDAPKQFILLVKTLRKFSPLELNNIFDRLGKKISSDTEVQKEKKQILLDAIIQVESDKSIDILLQQIEMRNLQGEEASQILSAIGLTNNPTERTVDRVMALCKGTVISGADADKQLRKTCWLAFSSLVHKACKINRVCSEEKIQEYSMNLLAGIKPTKTKEEQRMCLKAIGNTGLVLKRTTESETDSIDKIAEIAKSKVTDVDLRVQAIYSLRRVAKDEAKRVIPMCMPLIKDQTEDHEVRIACFVIVMDAEPEEGIVLSIVSDVKNDKSRQVASFIYTHFESLLENRPACNKRLYKLAKKALLELKPVVKGAQYSKKFMWSPTFYEQKVSLKTEASIIGTPTSPFPVSGAVKLGATVLNRQMNIMEVGFHAKCLRDIAEKILGVARPVRKTQEMLRMMNGRLPEDHEKSATERDLEKLDQELPTTEVHSDPAMMKASGYLKMFGNELRTFTVDKPTVWSYLEGTSTTMAEREEKMRLGENPYSMRKIFSLGRGVHEIPTEVGLPLHLWIDSAAILALDVSGQAVVTPRLTDILKNKDTKLETVDIHGTVKPRAAVAVMGKMQVSLDNVLAGLYLTGNLNTSTVLKGEVNVNVTKRLYKTKFDTPSHEHQAISLRSRPYTFTYIKPKDQNTEEVIDTIPAVLVRQTQDNFVKKLIKGRLMNPRTVTNTWSIGKENLGVEMELKTRRVPRSCSITYGPTHVLFNGPLDVNVTVRRGVNAPHEVVAQMQLENELKTQEQYQAFKDHFLHKQHFLTTSSSSESDSHEHVNGKDVPAPSHTTSFKTQPLDLLKRFEEWKYDSAKWPFTREEVEKTTHDHADHAEEVIPDDTKKVDLFHIYFNISTNGSQPIRELISRISLDQQNEFYKAVRWDVLTAEKTFRPNEIHTDQLEENTEEIRTLCLQGELEHPAYAMTLLEPELLTFPGLPDVPRDPKVLFKLNTQWGKSCENDQKMQLKARVERSDKQVKELQEETPYKQECRMNIQEGNKYTQACKTLRKEREELRAVHAELTHNELMKTQYKTFFYKGLDMIKNSIWADDVRTERAEVHNPDKTVLLTGELEDNDRKMNISIRHVRGNVQFNQVWIPQIVQDLKVLQPYKLQQHMVMSFSHDALSGRNINQCKSLKNDTIITFDKVLVNYEQSMCDHILAKDCSSKERFVVLTRKLTQTGSKKVVTVYLDNTKIQFLPRTTDEEIQILINNTDINLPVLKKLVIQEDGWKKVPVEKPTVHIMDLEVPVDDTVEEPHHHSSRERKMKAWDMPESSSSEEVEMTTEEEQRWEDFKTHVKVDIASEQPIPHKPKTLVQIVRTKLENSIMLCAPDQELKVFYDGHNVKVELPQKYKDMQCGLCGDFNGEVSNELVGPNREIYKNARQFGRSFQHTTPECAQDAQCAPAMEFAFDTEINLPGNDKQFACITKSPVPHCLPTCQPIQEEEVNVEFVCFEHEGTSDPFATKSRSEIIKKYKAKTADYKRTMLMHTKCVREE